MTNEQLIRELSLYPLNLPIRFAIAGEQAETKIDRVVVREPGHECPWPRIVLEKE